MLWGGGGLTATPPTSLSPHMLGVKIKRQWTLVGHVRRDHNGPQDCVLDPYHYAYRPCTQEEEREMYMQECNLLN